MMWIWIEALSDGVIAIVMTILILEFKVPKIESSEGIGARKGFYSFPNSVDG
ncbi:TMEM175 family protein [Paenibacillus sp. TAF58]